MMDFGNFEHGVERAWTGVGIIIVGHWETSHVGQSVWISHMKLKEKQLNNSPGTFRLQLAKARKAEKAHHFSVLLFSVFFYSRL